LGYADPLELARANGIKNPNVIQPGQILQLPGAGGGKKGEVPQTALAKAPAAKKDPAAYAEKVAASSPTAAAASKGTLVTTSWYGPGHHGRTMANGKKFNMYADTAAHKTLPFGTQLKLTNPANGNSVDVKITDRGPFIPGRSLDVSFGAARKLGMVATGVAKIKMEKI
jgi:rare lipoprotein A